MLARMRRATEANPVTLDELRRMAQQRFGGMVKAVVDLRRGIMLLDADMHADEEAELLKEGAAARSPGASIFILISRRLIGWSLIR